LDDVGKVIDKVTVPDAKIGSVSVHGMNYESGDPLTVLVEFWDVDHEA